MKENLFFSRTDKLLLIIIGLIGFLTTNMLFAAEDYKPNLIITAKIEIQGPGSTVKITNTQGTVVDGPAVVPPTSTETIQKSNDTITQQNPKNSTIYEQPDGTKTVKNADGSSVQTKPDGTQVIKNADGEIVK